MCGLCAYCESESEWVSEWVSVFVCDRVYEREKEKWGLSDSDNPKIGVSNFLWFHKFWIPTTILLYFIQHQHKVWNKMTNILIPFFLFLTYSLTIREESMCVRVKRGCVCVWKEREREREREKVECVEREKKGERTPNSLIIANKRNCITHNLSPSNITHTMYTQNTHTHMLEYLEDLEVNTFGIFNTSLHTFTHDK